MPRPREQDATWSNKNKHNIVVKFSNGQDQWPQELALFHFSFKAINSDYSKSLFSSCVGYQSYTEKKFSSLWIFKWDNNISSADLVKRDPILWSPI